MAEVKDFKTVRVEKEDGIAWVTLNRPEKRNAMNPQLHYDMLDALTELEVDQDSRVVVITGAGPSWCAGQDLREYFRGTDTNPVERRKASWASQEWRWRRLFTFPKPTIAMVNGFCFGLSEINWGIFPGGLVSRVLADAMSYRDAMWYIMTGDPFDGKKATELKLVNFAVPKEKLREETVKLAKKLMEKNPQVLRAAKEVYKYCRTMDYNQAEEYMSAKGTALRLTDPERGRETGMKQFLDEKTYRPGLGTYNRQAK